LAGSRHSLRVVPPESFASRLRRQRSASDLTQAQLAERFGVRQQTIGAWERGERPQSRFLADLAGYIGMDGERELLALLESQPQNPVGHDENSPTAIDADDDDAATMRLLARRFALDQESRPVRPEQAVEVYKGLIGYFQSRVEMTRDALDRANQ
jgi:transcriptional regulator with XRE-family HTH domain